MNSTLAVYAPETTDGVTFSAIVRLHRDRASFVADRRSRNTAATRRKPLLLTRAGPRQSNMPNVVTSPPRLLTRMTDLGMAAEVAARPAIKPA